MKKSIAILSLVLAFIMAFGVITASAKGNALSNDKFYVELPDGFEICTDYGDSHYYLENEYSYDGIEIVVEGNLRFPDGIKKTPENIIEERFKDFFYDAEGTGFAEIKKLEKGDINGISACYVYGTVDNELYSDDIFAYILTTEENLFVVYTTISSGIQEEGKQPDYLKDFMRTFLVNGTYYDGEKLSKNHDFSKAEHYIDALERDMLTDDYYEYSDDMTGVVFAVIILAFILPLVFIVFVILFFKTRKKLKEYKELFGPIEKARAAMYQQKMQNGYGAYNYNNQQPYGYAPNVPPSNMQGYNSGAGAYAQPQYAPPSQPYYQPTQPMQNNQPAQQYYQPAQPAQPVQPTQPAQSTLSPEMQEFQNNNVNN